MKKILILSILIFAVVFGISAEGNPTIAIMDVAATNTSTVKSQVIYEYIVDVVNRADRYTIVERSALQAALKEMEISSSGMVDDSTAAAIGKLAGAKLILISNLIVDDDITYLSARIVAVETGQVSNTAMLQKGDDEYIASLANRTISQLLGEEEIKLEVIKDDTKEKEVVEEKAKDEPVKEEEKSVAESSDTADGTTAGSRLSLTAGILGIFPVGDEANTYIFKDGFGFNVDLDYKFLILGKNSLSLGAGTGLFYDPSEDAAEDEYESREDVLYPFNMISIPLAVNLKYQLLLGNLYIIAKISGGGTYNIFTYTEEVPEDVDSTLYSLNAAIFPGLSIGYMISDKIGLALFGDWSMTFFAERPYTAVNAGLAALINL
ncbi:MAG: CsgG/HfaB family protein [Spirochaetota bacterium]|nr:CsgG/HfaB family protein [Spirochaetota bacterium]